MKREPATVPLAGPGQPARPLGSPLGTPIGDGTDGNGTNGSNGVAGIPGATPAAAPAALAAGGAALRRPATAPIVRGLPADPMRGAREAPGDARPRAAASGPGSRRPVRRIGRNEPCWCGSGQKYKKCHGA